MDDIQQRVFAAFQLEHKKHLESLRFFLASHTRDTEYKEATLKDVKRSAHTLKGAARAAGLECVQEISLGFERFFTGLMEGTVTLDNEVAVDLNSVLDGIETYVSDVGKDPGAPPPNHLVSLMDRLTGKNESPTKKYAADSIDRESGLPKDKKPSFLGRRDVRHRVIAAFENEYRTHLETMRRIVDEMTAGLQPDPEMVNTAFRSAHTLKGAARTVELPKVQEIAHRVETLFSQIRDGSIAVEDDLVMTIGRELDAIEDHVAGFGHEKPSISPAPMSESAGDPAAKVETHLSRNSPEDRKPHSIHKPRVPESGSEAIRIEAVRMDRIQRTAEQIIAEGLRHQLVSQGIKELGKTASDMARDAGYRSALLGRMISRMKDQPELKYFFYYIQNQRRNLSMLSSKMRELDRHQKAASRINENLSKQIQVNVQKARMVPAEDVFYQFRKMVRDLAADEGKKIRFHVRGLEVLVDRLVLQRLKDPLMHMFRNAVSHGVESPEERISSGKDPFGTIEFSIEIRGNRIRLTVADDGKGLDVEQIVQQAIKKGFASQELIDSMSLEERQYLIYQHGFTTAKMITDLHGRGIGMAVVREAVNRLRGDIHVESVANEGTCFILMIPLTISTHRLLLVRSGGQSFGIPVQNVDRLFRTHLSEIETIEGSPIIHFDNEPIPFVMMTDLLDIGDRVEFNDKDQLFVILLHAAGRKMGLAVDDVLSESEFLIKDLPQPADRVPFFSGGFIRGDGSVCLVVNPSQLLDQLYQLRGRELPFTKKQKTVEKSRARILIVDDSVTTRTLEKTILESCGYEILVAVDGIEALNLLKHEDVDLVVTDIQMPNMDGFGLIEEMKKSQSLQDLPVIIVSSMADQKDRERGLNLGADAYILKQKFDQKNLLETIGQIL